MATRYVLREDPDGSFSIVDIFTGQPAEFAGQTLVRIPKRMKDSGLAILNAMDVAQRELRDAEAIAS